MKIIGLGHYSRTGKDTFANAFVGYMETYAPLVAVTKQSLAWKLKKITHELYAWAGLRDPEYYETKEGASARLVVLPTLGMSPVEVWVSFGTKAVRDNVYDRTWLDYLLKSDLGVDILVIPDVRFPNEAEAIKEAGGTLIKIVRPGYGPLNTVADRALVGYGGWDYVIGADGKIETLNDWASQFAVSLAFDYELPYQSKEGRQRNLAVEVLS
jgi:hypothetical protein